MNKEVYPDGSVGARLAAHRRSQSRPRTALEAARAGALSTGAGPPRPRLSPEGLAQAEAGNEFNKSFEKEQAEREVGTVSRSKVDVGRMIKLWKRPAMRIVTDLHGGSEVIAEPQHHLRLGCGVDYGEPGFLPLDEWLRVRGIRCRLHGPYYSEFRMSVYPYDEKSIRFIEFEGPEDPEDGRWIELRSRWHCARLVEFLDPADEIRHRDALVEKFSAHMRMGFDDLYDTAFDPDCTIRSVRTHTLDWLVRHYGGLPGRQRTVTIGEEPQ
jgi:hypothetical protein